MLIVRKAEVVKQYYVSPICPKCNSDMARSVSDDTGMSDLVKAMASNADTTDIYHYAYKCVNCGNIEYSTRQYPFTTTRLDLESAEYKPEEEYNNANT